MSVAYFPDETLTTGWCGPVDFEALAETLPALIFVTDAQGANLYTNHRLRDFTGRAAAALLGTGWLAIIHPDDRDRARQTWSQAVQSAEPYEAAYRLRAADGTYHWHLVRGSAVREGGSVVRWVGTCTNIDDQKQAEAAQARMVEQIGRALAESEERLRLAQEAGGVGSYEWDVKTGTGHVSDSLRRIFGLRADEPADLKTLFSLVHPDDRRTVAVAIARTAAGPDLSTNEYRIVRGGDGEIRWLRDTGRTLRDKASGRTRWMGVIQDATDQQHAQAKLRASEERLRLALTAGQLGTWTYEIDSGTVSLDNLAGLICGLPGSAIRSIETARLLVLADSLDRFDAAVAAMRAGSVEFDDELRIIRGDDDEVRWVRLQGVRVQGPAGNAKIFGIIADITDQKACAERERLLAAEVDRRTKNVLAGVNALVELTHEDELERYKAVLQGRIRSLTRAHQAVGSDGASLAQLVADELAPYINQDRTGIQIGGPMLCLSPQAAVPLSLVLHELVSNAVEQGVLATPQGRLDVTWAMTINDAPASALALRWQERGIPRIASMQRRSRGSSLMHRIVEQRLNGRISVEPSSDGLRVDLVLPAGELLA